MGIQEVQTKVKDWWSGFKDPAMLWYYGITAVVVLGVIYFAKIKIWKPKKTKTTRRRRWRPKVIIRNFRRR